MSNIEVYESSNRGVSRRTGRALQHMGDHTSVQIARVESRADIQTAQVDAVAAVTQRAMQGVAFISQMEGQLGQAVPLAVTRLQAVGDLAALAMGQVITDTVTKLRRI